MSIDQEDALRVLMDLSSEDFAACIMSGLTHEWMYVFKPRVGGLLLYVKLVVRHECVVISFHEDWGDDDDEGED